MSVAQHAPPLRRTRGKLSSQEQQQKPAPFSLEDPSELLSFTSWAQPDTETPPRAGWVWLLLMCRHGCCRFEQRSEHTLRRGLQGAVKGAKGSWLGGCLCRSYYWGLFLETGREFLAWNWKDFSGVLGFGPPKQNVRHGGQLHHWATVRAKGGLFIQNSSDVIYSASFEWQLFCFNLYKYF